MDYSILSKLKASGFPQAGRGRLIRRTGQPVKNGSKYDPHPSVMAYEPTIEDLLTALGEEFDYLSHDPLYKTRGKNGQQNLWWATTWNRESAGGETAIEALSHLYLALHPSKEI